MNNIPNFKKFFFYLLHSAENMRIILGECSDAGKSGQLSSLFISVILSSVCISLGKFAVAVGFSIIDLSMMRTVHRLHREDMSFASSNLEKFVFEFIPVSAGLIQILFGYVRNINLLIAILDRKSVV